LRPDRDIGDQDSRPHITMAMVDAFLNKMYRANADSTHSFCSPCALLFWFP
jgi:hypothetical protein